MIANVSLAVLLQLSTPVINAANSTLEYNIKIRFVLDQLRVEKDTSGKPLIEGRSVSYGHGDGAFFQLFLYVQNRATTKDVSLMLKDPSPIVRVLGAKIILEPSIYAFDRSVLAALAKDSERVKVGPLDSYDHYSEMTVGDIVARMKESHQFLFQTEE